MTNPIIPSPSFYSLQLIVNRILAYFQEDSSSTAQGTDHAGILTNVVPMWVTWLQQNSYSWGFLKKGVKLDKLAPQQYPSKYAYSYYLPSDFCKIIDEQPVPDDFEIWGNIYNTNTQNPNICYLRYSNDYQTFPPHFGELLAISVAYFYAGPWARSAEVLANISKIYEFLDQQANATEMINTSQAENTFSNRITQLVM